MFRAWGKRSYKLCLILSWFWEWLSVQTAWNHDSHPPWGSQLLQTHPVSAIYKSLALSTYIWTHSTHTVWLSHVCCSFKCILAAWAVWWGLSLASPFRMTLASLATESSTVYFATCECPILGSCQAVRLWTVHRTQEGPSYRILPESQPQHLQWLQYVATSPPFMIHLSLWISVKCEVPKGLVSTKDLKTIVFLAKQTSSFLIHHSKSTSSL